MKKFLAILFVLFFSFSHALADVKIDFSSFSDDDLIELYTDVKSQFSERDLVFSRELEEGIYTIGADFPQGLYFVRPSYSAVFTVYSPNAAPNLRSRTYNLFPFSDSFVFQFYNGCTLTLESGQITLTTYIDGYTRPLVDMSPDVVRAFNSIDYAFDASEYSIPDYPALVSHSHLFYGWNIQLDGEVVDIAMNFPDLVMFTIMTPDSDYAYVYGIPDTRPDSGLSIGQQVTVYGEFSGMRDTIVNELELNIPSLMVNHIVDAK